MSDDKEEVAMAECGSCRAIVPVTSTNCPECNISFSGVSEESLGECGACNALVPLDSTKCPECGVVFVADDVIDILRTWMATNSMNVKTLFGRFDTNGDGRIDSDELRSGLLSLNLADLPPSQVEKLVQAIDEDGDSLVDLQELQTIIGGEEESTEGIAEDSSDEEGGLEYNENVLLKVMNAAEINESDKEAFIAYAMDYNSDGNSYLKKEELETAANAWNSRNIEMENDTQTHDSDEDTESLEEEQQEEPEEESDAVEESLEDEREEEIVDGEESDAVEESLEDEVEEETEAIEESLEEETDVVDIVEEESVENEKPEESVSESRSISQIYEDILDAIDEQDLTLSNAFGNMDQDGDRMITREELGSKLNSFLDYDLTDIELDKMMSSMDDNSDGNIDMIEFVNAIESHENSISSIDDEEAETVKTFPTKWHTRFMSKQWHDVVWPLIHTGFVIMIIAALANGLFPFVDGEGGTVELETADGNGWMNSDNIVISEGQAYPCEPTVQVGECKNSLTPLAGESSSMPGGFYLDGVLLIVLSTIGLIGSLYTHLVLAPSWRARVKAMKEVSEDKADIQDALDSDEDNLIEEEVSETEVEQESEEEETEELSELDEVEDEPDSEDDELDVGSYVGLDIDGEEYYGTIVEFDDDEGTVTIEEDESGDEITAYQDEMFIPED